MTGKEKETVDIDPNATISGGVFSKGGGVNQDIYGIGSGTNQIAKGDQIESNYVSIQVINLTEQKQYKRSTEALDQRRQEYKDEMARLEQGQQAQSATSLSQRQRQSDAAAQIASQRQRAVDQQRAEQERQRRESDQASTRLADQILERAKEQDPISQALAEQQVQVANKMTDPSLRQRMLTDYNTSQANQVAQTQAITEATQFIAGLLTPSPTKSYGPRIDYLGERLTSDETATISMYQQLRTQALATGGSDIDTYERRRAEKVKSLTKQIRKNKAKRTGKTIKGTLASLVALGGTAYGISGLIGGDLANLYIGGGVLGAFGYGALDSFDKTADLGRENRSLIYQVSVLDNLKIESTKRLPPTKSSTARASESKVPFEASIKSGILFVSLWDNANFALAKFVYDIPAQSTIKVLDNSGEYWRVMVDGHEGYVSSKNLIW